MSILEFSVLYQPFNGPDFEDYAATAREPSCPLTLKPNCAQQRDSSNVLVALNAPSRTRQKGLRR